MLNADVIGGLVNTVLSSKFDDASETPDFHREVWKLCCSKESMIAIAAPRGTAKTTAVTVSYGLSTLLFRERKYMILVSDTESQAVMFLGLLKDQLSTNEALIDLFGIKRNDKGIVQFVKDSESDVIVEMTDGHKFRIMAKGAEQKLRGLNWDGTRPDLIICDDMENDELVMNKERREKMRRWFNSALIPCLSKKGIIRVVGTILHMDSLLERIMPKPNGKWSHNGELKLWSEVRIDGWCSVKYRAHSPSFSKILWPGRFDKEWYSQKRDSLTGQGMADVYSQEYLNVPLDESTAYYKRADFQEMTSELRQLKVNYYITADLAIEQNQAADYTVFIVAAVDEHKNLQIRNVLRDRLDGREIVDTIISLQRHYQPEFFGIEEMQVSKAIGPFLREEMIKTDVYPNLVQLKHGGKDKTSRSRSMQARMRTQSVYFEKKADWYQGFEDELTRFPRDTHDDQFDAFSYLGMLLNMITEAPTKEEIEEEEYLEEFGDELESGRSSLTGY